MTRRSQRPVRGGRDPLPSCVIHEISREVERLARKFSVSKSFVIAVALADVFGIEEQEQYLMTPEKRWKKPLKLVRS
jgi:hypothetical protein